jgi:cell division protein ZapE
MDSSAGQLAPLARYRAELGRTGFSADPAQAEVAGLLDDLHSRLVENGANRGGGLLSLLRKSDIEPETGLYIWGGTGRGKTWLVDLFFESLPFPDKLRQHFHRFMAQVHDDLGELKGRQDPLDSVAERLAETTRIICFDEFFVSDIADAMILGTLFRGLFRNGVSLVATSNVPPQDLYKEGLQRARFLPAIDLISRHTRVVHLDGDEDYRLRTLERAQIYHSPLDRQAGESLTRSFEGLAPEACWRREEMVIKGRDIPTVRRADGVAWFEFGDICDGPRSQADYIEIARSFHSVLVSGVPQFDETLENQARRFIAMVDEFYDRGVTLILSAAVPLTGLYQGGKLAFEFKRTRSRLEEMQSRDYLARPHVP